MDRIKKAAKAALWFPVAAVYLLLLSTSTSPLHVTEGIDSALFKTMGRVLLNGGTPYADLFDNKGPVLYFINALGLGIGGNLGLLALQCVGFTLALYCVYRTARLLVGPFKAVVSVSVAMFLHAVFIQEGNQCEEWILYITAPVIYHTCRQMLTGGMVKGLWLGVGFGLSFFIRPTDAVALVGGMTAGVWVWLLWKKRREEFLRLVCWFVVGVLVVAVPILVWFAARHALGDLWYGMFGINMAYTGGLSMLSTATNRVKLSLLLLFIVFGALLWDSRHRRWLFLFAPMLALWLLAMGFKFYFHYYIVLLPVMALYVALLFRGSRPLAVAALAVLMLAPQTYEMRPLPRMARKIVVLKVTSALHRDRQRVDEDRYRESEALFGNIPQEERDSVWNGNVGVDEYSYYRYSVFYHSGIVQMNRQVGDFAGVSVDRPLFEGGNFPLWVVVDHKAPCGVCDDSVFAARYELVASTADTSVLSMSVYRRAR